MLRCNRVREGQVPPRLREARMGRGTATAQRAWWRGFAADYPSVTPLARGATSPFRLRRNGEDLLFDHGLATIDQPPVGPLDATVRVRLCIEFFAFPDSRKNIGNCRIYSLVASSIGSLVIEADGPKRIPCFIGSSFNGLSFTCRANHDVAVLFGCCVHIVSGDNATRAIGELETICFRRDRRTCRGVSGGFDRPRFLAIDTRFNFGTRPAVRLPAACLIASHTLTFAALDCRILQPGKIDIGGGNSRSRRRS